MADMKPPKHPQPPDLKVYEGGLKVDGKKRGPPTVQPPGSKLPPLGPVAIPPDSPFSEQMDKMTAAGGKSNPPSGEPASTSDVPDVAMSEDTGVPPSDWFSYEPWVGSEGSGYRYELRIGPKWMFSDRAKAEAVANLLKVEIKAMLDENKERLDKAYKARFNEEPNK